MADAGREKAFALICALVGNALFGLSVFFTKLAYFGENSSVSVLLMWRFIIAFVALNLMIPLFGFKLSFKGKKVSLVLLMAATEPILYFIFENYGLIYSSAAMGAVILSLIPTFALFIGWVVLKERATPVQIAFSLLSAVGAAMISLNQSGEGESTIKGPVLLLFAAMSAAVFYVISRRVSKEFSSFERTYVMFAAGTVFFTFFALADHIREPHMLVFPFLDVKFLVALAYLSVVSSVLAYMAVNYAASHLTASRVASFTGIQTVVSVLAGALFPGESITPSVLIASVLTVIGVYGVQYFSPESLKNKKKGIFNYESRLLLSRKNRKTLRK